MADDQDKNKHRAKSQARQERLAQKLRENLGRRKAQSRDRASGDSGEETGNED